VLYKKGDVGIPADEGKHKEYRTKTEALVKEYGRLTGTRVS
jgi:hypothetical protein